MTVNNPSPAFSDVSLPGVASLDVDVGSISASVATIAAVRSATSTSLTQSQCYVLGYYASSDGGEGEFVCNPADTTSADNGVTIIVDASGRRWYRSMNGQPVNARAAGVWGTGIAGGGGADDTLALNSLMTFCRKVSIPAGFNCAVSATINIPANTTVLLSGWIMKAAQSTGSYFNVVSINGSNVQIIATGGGVDGNKANQSGTLGTASGGIVSQTGYGQTAVTSLYSNILVSGVEVRNCVSWPISLVGVMNSKVEFCQLHDSGNSAQICKSRYSQFVNCTVYNISDDGLGLYLGNAYCTIDDCSVTGCATGPFILNDSVQPSAVNISCKIVNCSVYNNTTAGIFVAGQPGYLTTGHLISGNDVGDNGEAGDFDISNVSLCKITDNIAVNTAPTVVVMALGGGIVGVQVAGNMLEGVQSNIIKVANDAATGNYGLIIENNLMLDDSTSGSNTGIQLQCVGSSSYVTVRDNTFSGKFTACFSDISATPAAQFDGVNGTDQNATVHYTTQTLAIVANDGLLTNKIVLNADGDAEFSGQANANFFMSTQGMSVTNGNVILTGTGTQVESPALSVTGGTMTLTGGFLTYDPHIVGRVWLNNGVVTVSAG